jgi:hypothetical protein
MDKGTMKTCLYIVVAGVVIVGSILILYYTMSPYQNCVRAGWHAPACIQHTNW